MRLLIPQVDKLRPAYGMKEVNNTHMYTAPFLSIAILECNYLYIYVYALFMIMLMADCVGKVLH